MQCAACGTVWRATLPEEAPASAPPAPAPAPTPPPASPSTATSQEPATNGASVPTHADPPATETSPPPPVPDGSHAPTTGEDATAETPASAERRRRRGWRESEDDEGEEAAAPAPSPDPTDAFRRRLAKLRTASSVRPGNETAPTEAPLPPAETDAPSAEAPPPGETAEASAADTSSPMPEESGASRPVEDQRSAQMAEIRRMLDELKGPSQPTPEKDEDEGEKDETPPPAPVQDTPMRDAIGIGRLTPAAEPSPPPRKTDFHDPLRERLLDPETKARRSNDPDAARTGLMRRHQKRSRRRQVAERQRRSRGGFYTGLTLAVLAVAMVAGVYVSADRLAERFPAAEPALRDYVRTIDQARETTRAFLDRALERIGLAIDEVAGDE